MQIKFQSQSTGSPAWLAFFSQKQILSNGSKKGASHPIHIWINSDAFNLLHTECKRLKARPGKLLSKLILERSASFFSNPVQLILKK